MIKENKYRAVVILLGLLLISGWFYWFEIRTMQIRHECAYWTPMGQENRVTLENRLYEFCLHDKGL